MNIIIVGIGKVGTALADQLVKEGHNVVMVDRSAEALARVSEDIDAIRLEGNGASITTQMEAGIKTADIFISVTNSDEMNLLCCLIARKAGHCATIARVRNPVYSNEIGFIKEQMGISMIINPEMAAATEISSKPCCDTTSAATSFPVSWTIIGCCVPWPIGKAPTL